VNKKRFIEIRSQLGKTQIKMSQLLGISVKAIQSFEQGLRKIPVHIERQMWFIFAMQKSQHIKKRPCWMIKKCPTEIKRNCPAWEFQVGHLCWFINGTICQGEVQDTWEKKMKICRQCEVFRSILPPPSVKKDEPPVFPADS
jgi:DNA-binding XRE family transcriptional regulator